MMTAPATCTLSAGGNGEMMNEIQPGNTVVFYYNPNNPNNRTVHIRAIVDGDQVVVRKWNRRTRRWMYSVENMSYFEISRENWTKK